MAQQGVSLVEKRCVIKYLIINSSLWKILQTFLWYYAKEDVTSFKDTTKSFYHNEGKF